MTSDAAPAGPLSIALSCPKCGAPFGVDDEVVSVTCEHCGSLLTLSAPDRDEIYLADETVRSAADVLEVVILYRVQSQRAEIVSRHQDQDGNPPPEAFILRQLERFEERLRAVARVSEAHSCCVPYWHVTGKIVQGILGRRHDGPKLVRLRAFAVEHTIPGYDTRKANLRDRGLRLAAARVRPLTAREVAERRAFLPWVPVAEQSYREIEKWKGQDLDPGTEAVTKDGRFLPSRRLLVYRSYWLARVITDQAQEWVLVDASFGTIAGRPDEVEAQALVAQSIDDPLRSREESYRRVHIIASRCPDCGFEERFRRRNHVVICSNCHLALQPQPTGIRQRPYSHAVAGSASLDADYLPFWRYEATVQVAGAPARRLDEYVKALFPQGPPPGLHVTGSQLFVPAVRLLGTEMGDEAFQRLVEWIHGAAPDVQPGKVPLGGRPVLWGASVSEEEAVALAPLVLFGIHGKPSAARLNTMLVKKAIQDAKLTLTAATLVLLPFERVGEDLVVPGTEIRIPPPLLHGGHELDAFRITVYRSRIEAQGL